MMNTYRITPPFHFGEVTMDIDRLLNKKMTLSAFIFKYGYYFADEIFASVITNHPEEVCQNVETFGSTLDNLGNTFELYIDDKRKMYNNIGDLSSLDILQWDLAD